MRIERLFSSVPLRPAGGVYDPGANGGTEGALSAVRMTAAASQRAAGRIEAAQGRYTQALVQHGDVQKAFGRRVGELGSSLAGVAEQLLRKDEDRKRHTEIENRVLAGQQQRDAARAMAEKAAGPDRRGLEHHYIDVRLKQFQAVLDGSPDDDIRQAVEARLLRSLAEERGDVRVDEVRRTSQHERAQLSIRTTTRVDRAARSGSPAGQVHELEQIGSDLAGLVRSGALSRGEAGRQFHAARAMVRQRVIEDWSRNDPGHARGLLDAGDFDHLFSDDDEKAETRRFLADADDGLGSAAVTDALIHHRIAEDLRDRRAAGAGDAALDQLLAQRGSAGQRRTLADGRAAAKREQDMLRQIRFRPWSDVRDRLPFAGPPGSPREAAARRALMRDCRDWAEDPAAMAGTHPAADTPAGAIAVQVAKGVPAPAYFTRAQAADWTQQYGRAGAVDRQVLTAQLRTQAGPHLNAVLRDLAAAGLPVSGRLRLLGGDGPAAAGLWDRIEAAENTPLSELRFENSGEALADIDAALATELAPYVSTMAPALEGRGLARLKDGFGTLARKLALNAARNGMPPAEAARRTVAELFGDSYALADGMRVPLRFDAPAVVSHARTLRGRQLEDFAADPDATGVALAEGETVSAWRQRIAEHGRFATTPDDRTAVLLTDEGLPVRNADGRSFDFAFEDAIPGSAADDAPETAEAAFDELRRRLLWSQQAGPYARTA